MHLADIHWACGAAHRRERCGTSHGSFGCRQEQDGSCYWGRHRVVHSGGSAFATPALIHDEQIALFMVPFQVLLGWCIGVNMDLNFQVRHCCEALLQHTK